ncbi:hypothetical protein ACFV4N_37200 [Actinosynnema sp. NPDC059797]
MSWRRSAARPPDEVAHKPDPNAPFPRPKPWPWGPFPSSGPKPDPWDALIVEVAPLGLHPEPWVALDLLSDFDAAADYRLRTYDVSAYAGTTVTLRFTAVEDTGATTSFVIDDIAIETA